MQLRTEVNTTKPSQRDHSARRKQCPYRRYTKRPDGFHQNRLIPDVIPQYFGAGALGVAIVKRLVEKLVHQDKVFADGFLLSTSNNCGFACTVKCGSAKHGVWKRDRARHGGAREGGGACNTVSLPLADANKGWDSSPLPCLAGFAYINGIEDS